MFLIVWRFAGFYMLLLLVGLQGIPHEVYEAARIDGARTMQVFRRITLPLLKPSLALSTIMCVTGSILAFDQFYILTKGGPDGSTMTVVQLIYNLAFESKRDLGMAAALSVIVLLAWWSSTSSSSRRCGARPRSENRVRHHPRPRAHPPVLRADRRAGDPVPVPADLDVHLVRVPPAARLRPGRRVRLRQLRHARVLPGRRATYLGNSLGITRPR